MKHRADYADVLRICFPRLLLALLLVVICIPPISIVRAAPSRTDRHTPTLQTAVPRFEASDCPFQDDKFPSDERVECGYLIVPEDRSQPNSNTIQLAVAIIRTHNPTPAPDPILFLEGGPGYGALDSVGYFVADVPGLRAERDIILLDQRGTGYSRPDLRCVEFNELYASLQMENPTVEEQVALEVQAAQRCRDRLREAGINLAAYNTAENAADVNDLRIAFGYDQVNLYGFSYGSRLALTVMRDFPGSVRAAVLDSALPLQAGWWEEKGANVARAYATLFAGCADDPACHAAYPSLERHFDAVVMRFNAAPLSLNVRNAATGETVPQLFTGDDLVAGGFLALYDKALIAYLPLAIEQIYNENAAVIVGFAEQLMGDASVDLSGMWFSVECQDEAPFNEWGTVVANAEAQPRFRNFLLSDPTPAICEIWGVDPSPIVETSAVYSDIPALVLAGEYDPIHPPAWSRLAASTLSRSYLYELAGASHGVGFDGCGHALVVSFIHDPAVAPDATCVAEQGSPPFVTDLYLNGGIYPFASTLLADFDPMRALPLLVSVAIFLSVLVIWPFAVLAAWRTKQPVAKSSAVRWMGRLSFLAALLNGVFLVGLLYYIVTTGMEQPYLLLFGLPSQAAPLFVIPWISALLGVWLLYLSGHVWQRRSGSVIVWVYYTLVALAVVGFTAMLGMWGLIWLNI